MENNIFDILSIQETKIDDTFPDSQIRINMYRCYRNDCKSNEGGVMMFVRNGMAQRRRIDIESQTIIHHVLGRIELICVEVNINKELWLMISICTNNPK